MWQPRGSGNRPFSVLCLTCLCFLNVSVPPLGSRRRAAPETEVCVWERWNATVWLVTERACCCWSASWSQVMPLRWTCADSVACWDTLGGKSNASLYKFWLPMVFRYMFKIHIFIIFTFNKKNADLPSAFKGKETDFNINRKCVQSCFLYQHGCWCLKKEQKKSYCVWLWILCVFVSKFKMLVW